VLAARERRTRHNGRGRVALAKHEDCDWLQSSKAMSILKSHSKIPRATARYPGPQQVDGYADQSEDSMDRRSVSRKR
jgi:hypothetical protein